MTRNVFVLASVLLATGCAVDTPPVQPCCGSLHAHNGELDLARDLARRSIDVIPPDRYDAIIDNFCGVCAGPDSTGTISFNESESTDCGRGRICFDYTLPTAGGVVPLGDMDGLLDLACATDAPSATVWICAAWRLYSSDTRWRRQGASPSRPVPPQR